MPAYDRLEQLGTAGGLQTGTFGPWHMSGPGVRFTLLALRPLVGREPPGGLMGQFAVVPVTVATTGVHPGTASVARVVAVPARERGL